MSGDRCADLRKIPRDCTFCLACNNFITVSMNQIEIKYSARERRFTLINIPIFHNKTIPIN